MLPSLRRSYKDAINWDFIVILLPFRDPRPTLRRFFFFKTYRTQLQYVMRLGVGVSNLHPSC